MKRSLNRAFFSSVAFSLWGAAVLCSAAFVWLFFGWPVSPAAGTKRPNRKEKRKRRSKAPPHSTPKHQDKESGDESRTPKRRKANGVLRETLAGWCSHGSEPEMAV
jgi:hypothetical protein